MILIQNKSKSSTIVVQKPYEIELTNFTILLQNVVTKEIHQINVYNSLADSLFFRFENIDMSSFDDGEYYMLLISNPSFAPIEVSYNDVDSFQIEENKVYFLMNKGDYITNGELFLVISPRSEYERIKKITTDLLRVGTYNNPTTQYNNETKFIQYNG